MFHANPAAGCLACGRGGVDTRLLGNFKRARTHIYVNICGEFWGEKLRGGLFKIREGFICDVARRQCGVMGKLRFGFCGMIKFFRAGDEFVDTMNEVSFFVGEVI